MSFFGLFGGKKNLFTEPEKNLFKCIEQIKKACDNIVAFIETEKKDGVDSEDNQFKISLNSECQLLKKMGFVLSALFSKLLNLEEDKDVKAKMHSFLDNEAVKVKIVDRVLREEKLNYDSLELYFSTLKQSIVKMEDELRQSILDARQKRLFLEQQNMRKAG